MITRLILVAVIAMASCQTKQQSNTTTEGTDSTSNDDSKVAATAPNGADTSKTTSPVAYGIDISKYQGDEIDFITRKGDTLTFIICKATEGLTSIDPDFRNNWKMIDEKGFVKGAYHFYHCSDDPVKQAAHFVSTVDSFAADDLPPVIDFENSSIDPGCSKAQIQKNLLTFIQQVKNKTGRTPLIYTNYYIGQQYLNDAVFADYPLFIAEYQNIKSPPLPGAWKNRQWWLWQKSESYVVHSTTDDFDMFNGSVQDLKTFISRY